MRLLIAAVGMVALMGCVADGTLLPQENVDASYTEVTLRWSGTFGGSTTTYYIKSFEKDGMIALCGVRVTEVSAVADDLADLWFEQGQIAIGSRQNTVTSARFMGAVPPSTPRDQMMARCIKTNTPATDSLLGASPRVVGDEIVIFY